MDETELARSNLAAIGIEVADEDLPLVALVAAGVRAQVAALDAADTGRFPFEPVDPSGPPPPA